MIIPNKFCFVITLHNGQRGEVKLIPAYHLIYVPQIRDAENQTEFDTLNNSELVSRLMLAAGVNVLLGPSTRTVAFQDLLSHEVLLMRHREIVDISRGMQSLSLITFLKLNESLLNVVFPALEDMSVSPDEIKSKVKLHWEFSNNDLSPEQKQARSYFLEFIDFGVNSSSEEARGEDQKNKLLLAFDICNKSSLKETWGCMVT